MYKHRVYISKCIKIKYVVNRCVKKYTTTECIINECIKNTQPPSAEKLSA